MTATETQIIMKFTESHEWIRVGDDGTAQVGVTNYAQDELGDIVYVELPQLGADVKAGDDVVVLESTKAAADVYAPVSGHITGVNIALNDKPELVNQSAENDGWLFTLAITDPKELDALLDNTAYQKLITGS